MLLLEVCHFQFSLESFQISVCYFVVGKWLAIVYTCKASFLKFPNEYESMNRIRSACSALFGSNGCKTARTRT